MSTEKPFGLLSARDALSSIILIINTFVWLFCISALLGQIAHTATLPYHEDIREDIRFKWTAAIWTTNFCGASFSILGGAILVKRFQNRTHFFFYWILLGVISSTVPIFVDTSMINNVLVLSAILSVSLGIGLPAAMAEFAHYTACESRARLGGVTLLLIMGCGALTRGIITENILVSSAILALWRSLALLAFLVSRSEKSLVKERSDTSLCSVIKEQSFILYILPWAMFSLVNYLSWSVFEYSEDFRGALNISEEEIHELINELVLIGNVFTGVFAFFAGFLSDFFGRKRLTIAAFTLLGIGYATLGVTPLNPDSSLTTIILYFYTLVDGTAWGILLVIFVFTVWADLASYRSSEKYYALGSLPYLLSNFLRIAVGPFISNELGVGPSAIFSFAALFLFFAVLPLVYAPETLPEKKMKERELTRYIRKAQKIRKKHE